MFGKMNESWKLDDDDDDCCLQALQNTLYETFGPALVSEDVHVLQR